MALLELLSIRRWIIKNYGEKLKIQSSSAINKASVKFKPNPIWKSEIAFVLGDSVKYGWEGNAEAGFQSKLDNLRGIAGIYPNYVHIVASKVLI